MKTKTLPECTLTETNRIRKKENRNVTEIEMIKNCPKTKKAANDGSSAFDCHMRPTQLHIRNDHENVKLVPL